MFTVIAWKACSEGDGNTGVDAEAVAEPVQQGADAHFGSGVFAADAAHVPETALFREQVFVHRKDLNEKAPVEQEQTESTERLLTRRRKRANCIQQRTP